MYENGWLIGWKEVAKYLKVSTRTAKRYYYKLNMPVRPGLGHVRALTHELDIWLVEFTDMKKKE